MTKKKLVLFALLTTMVVGVSALLLFELLLRVIGFSNLNFHQFDRQLGSRLRPGLAGWYKAEGESYFTINSHGFADVEREYKKDSGVYRIAVLGDSYTEARQVARNESFCSVVEKLFNEDLPDGYSRVEVLNFGVSGYGTTQELILLQNEIPKYDPDLVILAFLTGNDVRNNSKALEGDLRPYFMLSDSGLVLDDSFKDHPKFDRAESFSYRAFMGASQRLRVIQFGLRLLTLYKASRIQNQGNSETGGGGGELGLDSEVYLEPTKSEWIEAWEITEAVIHEMATTVGKLNKKFFVVVLSTGIQVNPDLVLRENFAKQLGVPDLFYADHRIERVCADSSIECLLLAPKFLEIAIAEDECFHGFPNTKLYSGHWNRIGHRRAGEIIASEVRSRFLDSNGN